MTEIVAGGGYDFAPSSFWYILSYVPARAAYEQKWVSREYVDSPIRRLIVTRAPGAGERYLILVGMENGSVEVYDARSRQLLYTLITPQSVLLDMAVADVDGSGAPELVIINHFTVYVYDMLRYQLSWSHEPGSSTLAVANVDADSALEIVTQDVVLDGVSRTVQWQATPWQQYSSGLMSVADVDADGQAEILAFDDYREELKAYAAVTKSVKWVMPLSMIIFMVQIANVDGDAMPEMLLADSDTGWLHCYDLPGRSFMWTHKPAVGDLSSLALGDSDNDGSQELIWSTNGRNTRGDQLYVSDLATRTLEWESPLDSGPAYALDVGDVDADGADEIVSVSFQSELGYAAGRISIYDAATHVREWLSAPVLAEHAMGTQALKLANLDADPALEILLATDSWEDGVVVAYDGKTHVEQWRTAMLPSNNAYSVLETLDIDGDGALEVLAGKVGGVHVFDGATGAALWHMDGPAERVYDIVAGDLDQDGVTEVVFSTLDGHIVGYVPATQSLLWTHELSGSMALAIGDADGDQARELLVGSAAGKVYAFAGATLAKPQAETLSAAWEASVSSLPINALALVASAGSSSLELVVVDDRTVSLYTAPHTLVWKSAVLGTGVGYWGQLRTSDIDGDQRLDLVLGSSYAITVLSLNHFAFEATLDVDKALASVGSALTYTLAISNTGPVALTLAVTGTLSAHTSYLSDSLQVAPDTAINSNPLLWPLTLDPGSTASMTIGALVGATAPDGKELVNTIWISLLGLHVPYTATTLIDAAAPISTILSPQADEVISGAAYLIMGTAADALSAVERIEVRINSGPWQQAEGTTSWQYEWTLPAEDDPFLIQVRAVDSFGQAEVHGPFVWVAVDNLGPQLLAVAPQREASLVRLDEPLVLAFSEPVLATTLQLACAPELGGWSTTLSEDGKTVTVQHDPLLPHTLYSCSAGVQDMLGHPLREGVVSFPWRFSTRGASRPTYLPHVVSAWN